MRRLLLVCAAIALAGCGDSTGPVASAEGTWNLQTVNNSPLPYTVAFIANPTYRLEIVNDVFIVHGDGTYDETFTSRETNGTTVTTTDDADNGTWVQHGSALTITSSDGTSSPATISGNTITANLEGFAVVYRRQ
jgi:hypothetical protein